MAVSESALLTWARSFLPQRLRRQIRFALDYPLLYARLLSNYDYDRRRFLAWSSVRGHTSRQAQLRAWIDADTHKIEKGLALKEPRAAFGRSVVERLLDNLTVYLDRYGPDRSTQLAANTLAAYVQFNVQHATSDPRLEARVNAFRLQFNDAAEGGVKRVRREDVLSTTQIPIEEFFNSRFSVRQFTGESVEPALIERATRLARKTPTVCNRQSVKVYAYFEPQDRTRLMACQLGNAGFSEQAGAILVVTSDVSTFFSVGERNQGWIDGGLFSMSLLYGLHAVGLGACALNWSVEADRDKRLRSMTGIPDSEIVIMMIAVGHLPQEFNVAQSSRKPVSDLLVRGSTTEPR